MYSQHRCKCHAHAPHGGLYPGLAGIARGLFSLTVSAVRGGVRLVQTAANGELIVSWPTVSGPSYQVEYKTNLNDALWMPVGSPVIGSGGAITSTNSVNAYSQCYLRLKITP